MNNLAAAAEAGKRNTERYIELSFASKEDVRVLRLILRDAGQDHWLNDRHHNTLTKLGCSELNAMTYPGNASFFRPGRLKGGSCCP